VIHHLWRLCAQITASALLLLGAGHLAAAQPARAQGRLQPASFAAAYERAAAWSVGVYVFVPGEDEPRVGAGFFVDDQGGIATAAHLLGTAQQILIALPDKRLVSAEVEGRDDASDIALLRVSPPLSIRPLFGSTEQLRVGDWVMAVGEPFGLEHSVAIGIVSGKDRHFGEDAELFFIQTDVALNPGNSGGPLLDAAGAIVGMNARTIVGPVGTPGASLAIPIDIVRQIVTELRSSGPGRTRPKLGANFEDVPPLTAWTSGRRETTGAVILSVTRDSVAEQVKLRAGDIVTMMNGRPIRGSADLVIALLSWRKLSGTRIVVQRAGTEVLLKQD
jgi:S1-C subfamily serine protease